MTRHWRLDQTYLLIHLHAEQNSMTEDETNHVCLLSRYKQLHCHCLLGTEYRHSLSRNKPMDLELERRSATVTEPNRTGMNSNRGAESAFHLCLLLAGRVGAQTESLLWACANGANFLLTSKSERIYWNIFLLIETHRKGLCFILFLQKALLQSKLSQSEPNQATEVVEQYKWRVHTITAIYKKTTFVTLPRFRTRTPV